MSLLLNRERFITAYEAVKTSDPDAFVIAGGVVQGDPINDDSTFSLNLEVSTSQVAIVTMVPSASEGHELKSEDFPTFFGNRKKCLSS